AQLHRRETAQASLERWGLIIICRDLEEGIELANEIAPEHLELAVADPWSYLSQIRHAGAVFLGTSSPEPFGDYLAGPNHTLPTNGTARFFSPLGVEDFLRRSSVIACSPGDFQILGPQVAVLAREEGLTAHARAVEIRLEEE
ncbi:MAG: histidinol dehydrogenase, partial [Limnochordia bacterium]